MAKAYRAILLAAGLGTRLRPLTLTTPKCLTMVGGKPLLEHWLEKLEQSGCEEVLINTHYLSEAVVGYVSKRKRSKMKIETVYESELLGTAGTLSANRNFFGNSTSLMIHADNAMMDDLFGFLQAHENRREGLDITMLTFRTSTPKNCGILDVGSSGNIIGYHEKTADPPGNLANGALYAIEPSFLDLLGEMRPKPVDFSRDVVPRHLERFNTWHTNNVYIDVGTVEGLAEANTYWGNSYQ